MFGNGKVQHWRPVYRDGWKPELIKFCKGKDCKMPHDYIATEECSDQIYLQTGLCPNWKHCKDKHQFLSRERLREFGYNNVVEAYDKMGRCKNELKRSSKPQMMLKPTEIQELGPVVTGKRARTQVEPDSLDLERMKRLTQTVPDTEFQAALLDKVSDVTVPENNVETCGSVDSGIVD